MYTCLSACLCVYCNKMYMCMYMYVCMYVCVHMFAQFAHIYFCMYPSRKCGYKVFTYSGSLCVKKLFPILGYLDMRAHVKRQL